MENGEQTPGLDFHFGSILVIGALARLAKGLRWMFWGTVLQVVGVILMLSPVLTLLLGLGRKELVALLPVGAALTLAGGIFMLLGEQKCLHLELPFGMTRSLPGQAWLRGAYRCHLGSLLLKLARDWIGRGPISLIILPLQLIGFSLLLLFLRKMASALTRRDLARLVDAIFVLGGLTLMLAVAMLLDHRFEAQLLKSLPRLVALTVLSLPVVSFAATILTYAVLLWRLASAADGLSKFLAMAQVDIDEPAIEPALET